MRYVDRPKRPCEVCGVPTRAEVGVCQRSPECRRAYSAKHYGARAIAEARQELPDPIPCECCGRLTRSSYRVCKRTPECKRALQQRRYLRAVKEHPPEGWNGRCATCVATRRDNRRLTRLLEAATSPTRPTKPPPVAVATGHDHDCPNCVAKEQFFSREIRRLTRLLEAAGIDPDTATPSLLRPKGELHVVSR